MLTKAKHKTLRLSLIIVCAFICSWTPYYLSVILAILNPNSVMNASDVKKYLFIFSVSNTCFNPIIYGNFFYQLKLYGQKHF